MGLFETTSIYMGLATIVAAFTIIWYSRKRSAELDDDSRKAFRPLYIVAIGFMTYGFGNLGIFFENITGLVLLSKPYIFGYLMIAFEIILLGVAAAMILNSRKMYLLPVGTIAITGVSYYLTMLLTLEDILVLVMGIIIPAFVLG